MNNTKKTLTIKLEAERRKRYLDYLIKEAIINTLAEQEAMPPLPAATPSPTQEEPLPAQPTEDAAPSTELEEFTVDVMIERLNVIRGGKSFTDPVVYGQLVSYFKSLTEEQKQHMQAFLISLGKIVISVSEKEPSPPEETAVKQPAPSQVGTPPVAAPPSAPPVAATAMPATAV